VHKKTVGWKNIQFFFFKITSPSPNPNPSPSPSPFNDITSHSSNIFSILKNWNPARHDFFYNCNHFTQLISLFLSPNPNKFLTLPEWRIGHGFGVRRTKNWRRSWRTSGKKWLSHRKVFLKTLKWHFLKLISMSVTPKTQFELSKISPLLSMFFNFLHFFCHYSCTHVIKYNNVCIIWYYYEKKC
jgi:hypothetical protein